MRTGPSRLALTLVLIALAACALASVAAADHIRGQPCNGCASHDYWPRMDRSDVKKAPANGGTLRGGRDNDELLGHHGSDTLYGRGRSDVLWGDHDGRNQPASQHDRIYGGAGNDFIYGSHGYNRIEGGAGNDAISVHFGRGILDCGPGRDIYHVARSRKRNWKIRNCEKVDYRSERQRGGRGLKPLR